MKKAIMSVILGVMLVLMLGAVSATTTTVIAGKIYNSDYTAIIEGASVTVNCGGNIGTDTSLDDGSYRVEYTNVCVVGNTLNVSATFDGLYGSKEGLIKETGCEGDDNCLINVYEGNDLSVDVAVVNIPLVPEFGALVGVLTILGAVGVFFVVRRK